jgi:hypothetical protein
MAVFTNQVSVGVGPTPTLVIAARTRTAVTVTNMGTTPVFLGDISVTLTTGQFLAGVVGASETFPSPAALYGLVASGSANVSYADID